MKHLPVCIILFSFACTSFCITADEIVKIIDDKLTFNEGEMDITMTDSKKGKETKRLEASIIFKKDKGTLVEFTNPARERNKKILMVKDNMWMYVPGISKPVRLSGKDSFMGTSFSNRDLMDFDMNNDYNSKISSETDKEYKLELHAVNKSVTYPKIIMTVDREQMLPIKQELYTVSGNLIKTMEFSELRDFNGKFRPSIFIVKDILTQGNRTKVVISSMTDKTINENIFSPQNMAR